ncbi:MAG: hypothetical protein ACM3KE_05390 [Hyphomicrobiales bacterium]
MSRTRNKRSASRLLVSLGVSAAILLGGMHFSETLTAHQLASRLLWPLVQLMVTIATGLVAGQVIEATGWTRSLSILARPLFRFGRLGDRCGAAFTAAFVSGVASNAMLQGFYQESKITRQQLYLANFVNQLPAFFLHLPTTFFTVVSMTRAAGILYFGLTFAAALLRTLAFLAYGRWRLPPEPREIPPAPAEAVEQATSRPRKVWQALLDRIPASLVRIGIFVVPVYAAVFVLNQLGIFNLTRDWLTGAVVTAFVPMESLSLVVLSFVAEFTSGFAAAGALMDAGMLTVKQTVLALLIGNVLAFPLRALRHQLPHYMGIYAPRVGAELLVLGQVFRVASIIMVGWVFYVMF